MKSPMVVASVFDDYRRLVWSVAREWTDRFGGDIEENYQEGCLAFMRAYAALDPKRGAFSTLLTWSVRHHLSNVSARDRRKCRSNGKQTLQLSYSDGRRGYSNLADNLPDPYPDVYNFDDLSEDAQMVIDLVLIAPRELKEAADRKGGHPANWRKVLRRYLKGIGWTGRRIASSFCEIGDVFT
jgi:RNA polymerase sigma factor (sigma-70 family)